MQGSISRSAAHGCWHRPILLPLFAAIGAVLALGGSFAARAQDLFAGDSTAADPNPYYIGLSEAITHDSNINRLADGRADTYSSTGLVGGFNQAISRQRVHGSGNITMNRYRDEKELDHTSYSLEAGLDWQTIDRLSGTVSTRFSQQLASLSNNLLQSTAGRNLVRTEQLGARANWGTNAEVSVQGGYGHSRTSYSSPSYQASGSNDDSADIGAFYQPGPTVTLGTSLRYTRSNADQAFLLADGSSLANKTNGRNIDLSVSWRPTVQSGANARVSWTHQSSTSSGGNGFSGLTGALSFNYRPTGKLSFNGQINRDASTNGSFYNTFTGTTLQPTVGLAANSTVSTGASVGAAYSATAKVNVTASLQITRSTQEQTGGASNQSFLPGYSDHLKSASLGAFWSIRRYWSAGCNLQHVQRQLSGSFLNDYTATTFGCSTQVTLQ